jgi:hypothetical protein
LPEKREMARGFCGRRGQMMSAEWTKSTSTESSIRKLIDDDILFNAAIGGWRPSISESYLDPRPGEVVVFEDFY